ncbi:MAG: tetratricopeptide repeat protein [Bacteroidales bacterium]|nr:tetratricopeptide repeat protein [Bacteroidales bacterium]
MKYFLIFINFIAINIFAQNNVDSLKKLLNTTEEDSNDINLLVDISLEYIDNNYDSTLYYLEKAKNLSISLKNEEETIKIYQYISIAHSNNADYYSEIEILKKALKITQKLKLDQTTCELLHDIGLAAKNTGNFSLALEYFNKSLEISIKNDYQEQILNCYIGIGNVFMMQAEYNNSIQNFYNALKIAQETENTRAISLCYNNIGNVYYYQNNFDKALEYYQKDKKNLDENFSALKDKKTLSQFADNYNNIGACYFFKEDYVEAFNNYTKSLKIYKELNSLRDVVSSYYNIGELFLVQKKYDSCSYYYYKAYNLSKEINDKYSIVLTSLNLGIFYKQINNLEEAIHYLQVSYILADSIGAMNFTRETSKQLSDIYYQTGDFKKAYDFLEINKKLNDSIVNESQIKKFTQLEMQFEYDEKQKIEQIKLDAEKKHQKVINYSLISIIGLLSLLAIFIIISLLRKTKANKILIDKNLLIANQKEKIEKNHKNINDSINYASKIQQALLPTTDTFTQIFPKHFILYKPRDIVSGDFYYLKKIENKIILAVADCTGHGVPGAFVSMLGIAFLNEIIRQKEIKTASQILEELRLHTKTSLKQTGKFEESKEGMDIALCIFEDENQKIQYSGAYNSLFLIRDKKLTEYKATRTPIGIHVKEIPFTNHEITIKKHDLIYLLSDGYADQFDENFKNKYLIRNLKSLLLNISDKPMQEQKSILIETFENWKKTTPQNDDVLIVGINI